MRNIFKFLSQFSTQPNDVDKIIISSFLEINNLQVVKNDLLRTYVIAKNDTDNYSKLLDFCDLIRNEINGFEIEQLIQLFEFVISPADRIVNGAIYTPLFIRKYITGEAFKSKASLTPNVKIADIACGCGGFLLNAAIELRKHTLKTYAEIFKYNIYGLDIQEYSINRTKLLLSLLALKEGEDTEVFDFNLFTGDALEFDWNNKIKHFSGFDIILGNPPYVCARNLDEQTKEKISKWEVCKSGNPDLYIPFFQIGIENLAPNGCLSFITMNSFFKSLNGRDLREYFKNKSIKFKIIDFGTGQVFKSKNTYTCICTIENTPQSFIKYYKSKNLELPQKENLFSKVYYSKLDTKTGWNLHNHEIISKIESVGVAFGELYKTRHGIATLKNDIYIFNPVNEDENYYYLQNGSLYQIEKEICKDIINSNKLSRAVSLNTIKEKVIFPYDNGEKPKLLKEDFIKENYPKAYKYLQNKRAILAQRDKGKGDYENWFAFGRTQSLERIKNKMFFPKFSDRTPSVIINNDENMLFYNGQAVVGHNNEEMLVLKKIMESKLFWYYIKTTSKPYSSDYYSFNGNYIRNFGICNLNKEEKAFIINETNQATLDLFFEEKYGIKLATL